MPHDTTDMRLKLVKRRSRPGSAEEQDSNSPNTNDNKPAVILNHNHNHENATLLMAAVQKTNDPPYLFRRGRELIEIEKDGSIVLVGVIRLMDLMDQSAQCYRMNKSGELYKVNMPSSPAKSALSNISRLGLPEFGGVIHTPMMLASGQIIDKPGYDPASKLYLALPPDFRVLSRPAPSQEAAREAYDFLARPLKDLPYADEASRANVMGFLLGIAAKNIINAMSPYLLVVSPSPNTGKSILSKGVIALAAGVRVAVNSWPDNKDQLQKLLLANFRDGSAAIIFDNIDATKKLNPAALNTVGTSGTYKDRHLGTSSTSTFDLRGYPIILNGNRLQCNGEFARRCVLVSFRSKTIPAPVYEHAGEEALLRWCISHQSELNANLLTILESWLAECKRNGPPGEGRTPDIDSYEMWTKVVSSIMWYCGHGESFLAGREEALADIADDAEIDFTFIGAVQDFFKSKPFRAVDLWNKLAEGGILHDLMPESLIEIIANTNDRKSRAVGDWLQQRVGTRFGTIILERLPKNHRDGVALYKLT